MNKNVFSSFRNVSLLVCILLSATFSGVAQATLVTSGFGSVPGAFGVPTFTGTGIAVNTINWAVYENAQNEQFILGMSATERFSSPEVTNDGAGTYFAESGLGAGSATASTWNFNFFIATLGPSITSVMDGLKLYYDVDPGMGSDFGIIDFFAGLTTETVAEGSQNLTFSFLYAAFPGITPPAGIFNPFDAGHYGFRLEAEYASASVPGALTTGSVGIAVRVPEPEVIFLLATGIVAFGMSRRLRRQVK